MAQKMMLENWAKEAKNWDKTKVFSEATRPLEHLLWGEKWDEARKLIDECKIEDGVVDLLTARSMSTTIKLGCFEEIEEMKKGLGLDEKRSSLIVKVAAKSALEEVLFYKAVSDMLYYSDIYLNTYPKDIVEKCGMSESDVAEAVRSATKASVACAREDLKKARRGLSERAKANSYTVSMIIATALLESPEKYQENSEPEESAVLATEG